jgi:hypothetical protein
VEKPPAGRLVDVLGGFWYTSGHYPFFNQGGGRIMSVDIPVKDHIRALEEQLLQPNVRKSAGAVAALLDDRFREFRSSGCVADKEQTLASLSEELAVRRTISEFEVVHLSPEVVLATYRAERHDPESESPVHSLRSSLWVCVDGQWRVVFHQGTSVEGTHRVAGDRDRP